MEAVYVYDLTVTKIVLDENGVVKDKVRVIDINGQLDGTKGGER